MRCSRPIGYGAFGADPNVTKVFDSEGDDVEPDTINAAVVMAIKDSAVPHLDKRKVVEAFGTAQGELLTARISALVQQAVGMPIEWGNMTLEQGVNEILRRFSDQHPELSQEALHEIGRCIGWNLR